MSNTSRTNWAKIDMMVDDDIVGSEIMRLEPDVAEMFTSADAVNEALRLLIQIAQRQPAKDTIITK